MKKTTLAIGFTGIVLTVIIILYVLISQNKRTVLDSKDKATPTQSVQVSPTSGQTDELEIVSQIPANTAVNIQVDATITISFNKVVDPQTIIFSIGPAVPFKQRFVSNDLIITFDKPLSPGTFYTYTLKYPNSDQLPQSYFFTTSGPTQKYLPNTYPGYVE